MTFRFCIICFLACSFTLKGIQQKKKIGFKPSIFTQTEARTISLILPAPRGQIIDRNGLSFALNKTVYFLAISLSDVLNRTDEESLEIVKQRLRKAKRLLGRDIDISEEVIREHIKKRKWIPLRVSRILDEEKTKWMRSRLSQGLILFPIYQRLYPHHHLASHILGHVGIKQNISKSDIRADDPLWPIIAGRTGIELAYDEHLNGKNGNITYLFDNEGNKISEEVTIPALPGKNVVLTLDIHWQKFTKDILDKKANRGAIVIVDIQSGDIIAMASTPSFDPNDFVFGITSDKFSKLRDDPSNPLYPRSFGGSYPPGSIFKPITALAALERKVVDSRSIYKCPQSFQVGNLLMHNWKDHDVGYITLSGAIEQSCNTWFYQVGILTGINPILRMARLFGFGTKPDIQIQGVSKGRIPDKPFMKRMYGKNFRFTKGDVCNLAIGQGSLQASPLQAALAMAAIANGQYLSHPRIVMQIQTPNNEIEKRFAPRIKNQISVAPENRAIIRKGMIDVVQGKNGTAKGARNNYVEVAGKTGTAQWGKTNLKKNLAWFAGFIPARSPKYAFAAVYEGRPGQKVSGGAYAAPMIGAIFNEAYANPQLYKTYIPSENEFEIDFDPNNSPIAMPVDYQREEEETQKRVYIQKAKPKKKIRSIFRKFKFWRGR